MVKREQRMLICYSLTEQSMVSRSLFLAPRRQKAKYGAARLLCNRKSNLKIYIFGFESARSVIWHELLAEIRVFTVMYL